MNACRSPDSSKIKQKMLYAASKDALRKKLVGVATEIQATDLSEISHDIVLDKVSKSVSFRCCFVIETHSVGLIYWKWRTK
jgi:tRNA U34 2-thiouridine synthase MnmA/TrmU